MKTKMIYLCGLLLLVVSGCDCDYDKWQSLRNEVRYLSSEVKDLKNKQVQMTLEKEKADYPDVIGVLRHTQENENLYDVYCPHCDKKVAQVGRDGSGFWWTCTADDSIKHHLPSKDNDSCELGRCRKCGEMCCVSEGWH